MTSQRDAASIITAMIGTAMIPLTTALQYRARIGSTAPRLMIMPTRVARATVP